MLGEVVLRPDVLQRQRVLGMDGWKVTLDLLDDSFLQFVEGSHDGVGGQDVLSCTLLSPLRRAVWRAALPQRSARSSSLGATCRDYRRKAQGVNEKPRKS